VPCPLAIGEAHAPAASHVPFSVSTQLARQDPPLHGSRVNPERSGNVHGVNDWFWKLAGRPGSCRDFPVVVCQRCHTRSMYHRRRAAYSHRLRFSSGEPVTGRNWEIRQSASAHSYYLPNLGLRGFFGSRSRYWTNHGTKATPTGMAKPELS